MRLPGYQGMQYFDHNATTPLSEAARNAWLDATERFPGNPSSPHRMGTRADRAMTEARELLGSVLGCNPLDLIWTSGATESSNLVFHHYAQTLAPEARVWVSGIEHPCVLMAAKTYLGDRVETIPVSAEGVVNGAWMDAAAREAMPALVVIMAANNEVGVLQNWSGLREWCRARQIPYFCDAAQWIGKLPAAGLGDCDWVIGCAHKFGGPKGVGFLKCRAGEAPTPQLLGGPQEWSRRAGTENVPGILAMLAALQERESLLTDQWVRERVALRDRVVGEIIAALPGTRVLSPGAGRLWNTVSLVMPECDCRFRWVVKLDREGFAVSTGSACSSGQEKPSHVLEAMGCSSAESSRVIRCSSGPDTTEADWRALCDAMIVVGQQAPPQAAPVV